VDSAVVEADDSATIEADDSAVIEADDSAVIEATPPEPEPEPEPEPTSKLAPAAALPAEVDEAKPEAAAAQPESPKSYARHDMWGRGQPLDRARLAHLYLSGFTQVDYLHRQISEDQLADGSGEPLNENRFLLRHARVRLDGDWRYAGFSAATEFFAEGYGVRPVLFDIHAQLPGKKNRPPIVQLRAGLFPVAFGFEDFGQTDWQRFFGERSLVAHAFVPGRFDLGVALSGHIWAIDWVVALQNGEPIGAPDHEFFRDPNQGKDVSGRIRIVGELFPWLEAATAVSAIYGHGFSAGTPPSKDSFEWQDLNEDGRVTESELIPIPGSAGRPSENFERWGVGGDLQLWTQVPKLGQLMLYGEAAFGVNLDRGVAIADPVLLGRDQRSFGWYAALTQDFTKWATLGIRYEEYEPSRDALELFDGITVVTRRKFQNLSTGLSTQAWPVDRVKVRLLAEYEHQWNTLGRDNAGRPAQLDNDTLRFRMEMVF
jgi:hypothetical protein